MHEAGARSEHEKKKYKKKKQPEDNEKIDGMNCGIVEEGSGASLVENQAALKKNKKKNTRNFEIEEGLCDIVQEEEKSEHKEKYRKKKQPEDNGKMDAMNSGIVEEGSSASLVENQVALKKHKKKKTKNLMSEEGRGVSNGKFETDVEKDVEEAEIKQHGSQDGKMKKRKARDDYGGGSEAPNGEENRKWKLGNDGLVNLTVDANMEKRRKDRDGDGGGCEAPKAEENRKRKQRDGDLVNFTVTNMKKRKKDNVLKVGALSTGPTPGEVSGEKNREAGKVAADDNNIVCDIGRDKMENVKSRKKKNDKKLENPNHLVLEICDAERAMVAENEVSTNHDKLLISLDKAKMKGKRAHGACEFKVDSHDTCTNGNQLLGMEVRKAAQEISEMPSTTTILNKKGKKSKKDENSENQEAENHSENTLKNKDKLRKPIQAAEVEGNKETSSVRKEKATDDLEVCDSKNKKCFKKGSDVSCLEKKKVSFSSEVEVFPYGTGSYTEENAEIPIIQGKRFSKEEDQKILEAINEYIKTHQLGEEEGMHKIIHCQEYPEIRNCWKIIGACLPNRLQVAIYCRAHVLLEYGRRGKWEPDEYKKLLRLYSIHGPKWKIIADQLGRHRKHVKDAWRSIKSPDFRKGTWSQEEYQTLFDLVNMDLRLKVFQEKSPKNYMLRDNISWDVISQKLGTRFHSACCHKWYGQLVSPLVKRQIWNDKDDYLLVDALRNLDACCYEDVDWDNLLEHRPGAVCRRRWTEMVRCIGMNKVRPFIEQVEVLSQRYCAEMIEYR